MNKYTLILALTLLIVSCKTADKNTSKVSKPNVVFILVDDLGWTDLGSYGSDLYQSPNIDRLANEGVSFTNSYSSCTVCSPTRASIVTGKYPARNNITDWIEGHKYPWAKLNVPDWTMYLPTEEYTMAEAFKDAGYKTAHFGKWHLGEKEENWPENHGFDVNIGGWKKGSPNLNKKKGTNGYFSPYGNPRLKDGPAEEYLTERLSNEVLNYIDENADEPFFINFWLYNVHTPLQAKKDKIDKYKELANPEARHQNPKYAAMVEHTDDAVGKIINKLKEKGLYDNTIIIFSSDNGGLIGKSKKAVTSNAPLRTGKGDIYEGGVRIPTIIFAPNKTAKGIKIDEPIISMDYYPTLMELAGISSEKTKKQTVDGKSLASLILDNKSLERDAIYWHYPHYHQEGGVPYSSIRYDDFKLIQNFENNSFELYNLRNDMGESDNVIEKYPEEFKLMKDKLETWRQDVSAQYATPNPDFNKKMERKKSSK